MTDANPVVETKPNEVPTIPSGWEALGAATGYNPREAERLRLWIIGPSGEGKTTFVNSIPRTLILDFEDGAGASPGAKAIRIHVKNFDHYTTILDKLLAEAKAGKRSFDRVVMDTVDRWSSMIELQLQKEKNCEDITDYGGQGKGYALIRRRCWSKVQELELAGYTWGCVGHMTIKRETNPVTKQEVHRPRATIYPGFASLIQGESDFQLTIYSITATVDKVEERKLPGGKVAKVKVGKEEKATYYLSTLTTADKEGKGRGVPTMDRKIELPLVDGWQCFMDKYNEAVEEAKKTYNQ